MAAIGNQLKTMSFALLKYPKITLGSDYFQLDSMPTVSIIIFYLSPQTLYTCSYYLTQIVERSIQCNKFIQQLMLKYQAFISHPERAHFLKKKILKQKNQQTFQRSATANLSIFFEQDQFAVQPHTQSILHRNNPKVSLINSLKRYNQYRKLFNQSIDHKLDHNDFLRFKDKFTQTYDKREKWSRKVQAYRSFWEEQPDKSEGELDPNSQGKTKNCKNMTIHEQRSKIKSFQSFVTNKKRIQIKKRSQNLLKKGAENKMNLQHYIQVYGLKKCIGLQENAGRQSQHSQHCKNDNIFKQYGDNHHEEQERLDQKPSFCNAPSKSSKIFETVKQQNYSNLLKQRPLSSNNEAKQYRFFNNIQGSSKKSNRSLQKTQKTIQNNRKKQFPKTQYVHNFKNPQNTRKNSNMMKIQGWRGDQDQQSQLINLTLN